MVIYFSRPKIYVGADQRQIKRISYFCFMFFLPDKDYNSAATIKLFVLVDMIIFPVYTLFDIKVTQLSQRNYWTI